jgi:hypothetical protein
MNKLTWTDSFPGAKIKDTKKKFYDRYAFCLEYKCPGARIIANAKSTSNIDILSSVKQRVDRDAVHRRWKYNQWPRDNMVTDQDINYTQISEFVNFKFATNGRTYMRIEEPSVRIYCNDEEELYQLATAQFIGFRHTLLSVFRPSNSIRLEQIADGSIIMKQDIGYLYKFILCDGRYGKENKKALIGYLDQLGNLVKVSATVRRGFLVGDYLHRIWFYSNEFDIKTMIDLITPGAVSKIHTIVYDN